MTVDILYFLNKSLQQVINNENHNYRCTIENSQDSNKWIQIKYNDINMHYPSAKEPQILLEELGIPITNAIKIVDWEATKYLTFEYDATKNLLEANRFINHYLQKILNCCKPEIWTIMEEYIWESTLGLNFINE